jgi:predicted GIY-YIG superfamily endonuclease
MESNQCDCSAMSKPRTRQSEPSPHTNGVWTVYVLRCADGSLYTGITNDPRRRCAQHNAGKASRYTRSRRPVVMTYQEPQADRGAALRREAAIKALSRAEKEALVSAARVA